MAKLSNVAGKSLDVPMEKLKSLGKVKVTQLYAGLDLIGSKTSVNHRDADMDLTLVGVLSRSKKTKRVILLPWANVKGCELFPMELEDEAASE